jgi:phosphate transport system permease protein
VRLKHLTNEVVKYLLLISALVSILIVVLIFVFTFTEAQEAFQEIRLQGLLTGGEWRPGHDMYGIRGMIAGSILVTIGAIVLGVPISVGAAVFLAEVAPDGVREIVRPAVELLAGIPSVVYGLFGMVVIVPLIAEIPAARNSGFGLLSASIVLAVMILPTVTNIAEDAIRAVPKEYKEGSLALGSTHWQTIVHVILPAARSGIVAAIILGIGRALGETMAMIMVIGNSIGMPSPLVESNPLSIFLSQARTLTGNIAVEIAYSTGVHRSAIFATGVILFLMIILVNILARLALRGRSQ